MKQATKSDVEEVKEPVKEEIREVLPITAVIEVPSRSFLRLTRGDIVGKDLEDPEWIEQVKMTDKTFYIVSEKAMERMR